MRCWTTPGTNSMDSRARPTRSKRPPSTYSARALLVHRRCTAPRRRFVAARCLARSALSRLHTDAQCLGCFQLTMLSKAGQQEASVGAFVACRASRKSSSGKLRSFSSDSTVISRNLPAHTSFATRDLPLSASSGKGRMRLSRLRSVKSTPGLETLIAGVPRTVLGLYIPGYSSTHL